MIILGRGAVDRTQTTRFNLQSLDIVGFQTPFTHAAVHLWPLPLRKQTLTGKMARKQKQANQTPAKSPNNASAQRARLGPTPQGFAGANVAALSPHSTCAHQDHTAKRKHIIQTPAKSVQARNDKPMPQCLHQHANTAGASSSFHVCQGQVGEGTPAKRQTPKQSQQEVHTAIDELALQLNRGVCLNEKMRLPVVKAEWSPWFLRRITAFQQWWCQL